MSKHNLHFSANSGIFCSCLGYEFYYHKIHETTKMHVFWYWIEKQKLNFQFCG